MQKSRALCAVLLAGCWAGCPLEPGSTHAADAAAAPLQDAGVADGGDGSAADAGVPVLDDEPWCNRVRAQAGPEVPTAVELSRAHARVRYFGPLTRLRDADTPLVEALEEQPQLDHHTLHVWAQRVDGVCRIPVVNQVLPQARVDLQGATAWVHPGNGAVEVPTTATHVVLDFRGLVESADLEEALAQAVGAVVHDAVDGLSVTQVVRAGMTDEAFAGTYTADLRTGVQTRVTGLAEQRRPLAVVMDETLAPTAARWAVRLRLARVAWLVGPPVEAHLAESTVLHGAAAGFVWRNQQLSWLGQRVPDLLAADEGDPAQLPTLWARGDVTEAAVDEAQRLPLTAVTDFNRTQPGAADSAHLRAALLSFHGAANLFFPYFDVVGNHTDERLEETLHTALDVDGRAQFRDVLRRFGNVLQDGHNWTVDNTAQPSTAWSVYLDDHQDRAVVARSYSPAFVAGDTILSVDGTPTPQWLHTELARSYGATDGSRRFNAWAELTLYKVPRTVRVLSPQGEERDVDVVRTAAAGEYFAGSIRGHGPLSDLGHPELFYMNLDGAYARTDALVMQALSDAQGARALILDMRGHPASAGASWDPYAFLQRLIPAGFGSPRYRVPVLVGGDHVADEHPYDQAFSPLEDVTFHGPVVFVVDRMAVSFAEDFSMLLLGAQRATAVVGRPTAGTTGSVTGMQVPGNFSVFLTGMEARWPDGSVLYGQGVQPTHPVVPTAADYAEGKDPFLRAAVDAAAGL